MHIKSINLYNQDIKVEYITKKYNIKISTFFYSRYQRLVIL